LSARVGTDMILRFRQPQFLRVITQFIGSSLHGFATASLSAFSVPLIPDTLLKPRTLVLGQGEKILGMDRDSLRDCGVDFQPSGLAGRLIRSRRKSNRD
jgi:hypothetical protein